MTTLRDFVAKFWDAAGPIVLLFLALGALVALWYIPSDYSQIRSSSEPCSEPGEPDAVARLPEGVTPVPLELENAEGVLIDFWRDRGTHWRTVYLQAPRRSPQQGKTRFAALEPQTLLAVSERPLERQELSGNIGPGQYVATAQVTARREVSLTICLGATGFDVDPGTYVGSVRIVGRAIQPVTVPLTVSLQYSGYRWIVPLLGIVTFVGGSFLVWASHKRASAGAQERRSTWRDIGELPGWIADNYVGVAGGAIATISVFIARYWRNAPWGANAPEDWFALLGGMFTAYTTTLTAATALVTPRSRDRGIAPGNAEPDAPPDAGPQGSEDAGPEPRELEGAHHRGRRQPRGPAGGG